MRLNLKGNTALQYSAMILRDDFRYSIREIAKRLGMSETGVRYILNRKK
jgi:DNA-directed RNA polymerase specialized sigma24 family protein